MINPDNLAIASDSISNDLCVVAGTVASADYSSEFKAKEPAAQAAWKDAFTKMGISPSKIVAENFYNNWIKEKELKENGKLYIHPHGRWLAPDYTLPGALTITDATNMDFTSLDGKKYSVDKEDGGLVYVPESGNVCFLATYVGDGCCDADENGLDNDCLGKETSCNIFLTDTILVPRKNIKFC